MFLLAWVGRVAVHHSHALALPRAQAVARVRADPASGPTLARLHSARTEAMPVDSRDETVWLYDGARLVYAAVVTSTGHVAFETDPAVQRFAYGSNIANDPWMLALLSVVFALMTAVWPLWRLRNLDVLAATGSTAAIVLLNGALIGRMVLAGSAALAYLAARCAWLALGPVRARGAARPLFDALTARWTGEQRLRTLRLLALACALMLAMVGISSRDVVDVGYAVMQGATDIVHGVIPYGHVVGILHGDT